MKMIINMDYVLRMYILLFFVQPLLARRNMSFQHNIILQQQNVKRNLPTDTKEIVFVAIMIPFFFINCKSSLRLNKSKVA